MLRKTFHVAIIFLFTRFSYVQLEDDCKSIRNCQQCIYKPSCSWYIEYGSTNGSGCFQSDYLEQLQDDTNNGFEQGYSHPPKTSFHITKIKKNAPISPQEVSINIRLSTDEPFTFPITFTPKHKNWGIQTVELDYKLRKSESVKISFSSNCNGQYPQIIETNRCPNVQFGDFVRFFVTVEAVGCSRHQPQQIGKIDIYASPSPGKLRLNFYAYCYCPCEFADSARSDPYPPKVIPNCRNRGSFTCGVCYCREGYAGKNCEINTSNTLDE